MRVYVQRGGFVFSADANLIVIDTSLISLLRTLCLNVLEPHVKKSYSFVNFV